MSRLIADGAAAYRWGYVPVSFEAGLSKCRSTVVVLSQRRRYVINQTGRHERSRGCT